MHRRRRPIQPSHVQRPRIRSSSARSCAASIPIRRKRPALGVRARGGAAGRRSARDGDRGRRNAVAGNGRAGRRRRHPASRCRGDMSRRSLHRAWGGVVLELALLRASLHSADDDVGAATGVGALDAGDDGGWRAALRYGQRLHVEYGVRPGCDAPRPVAHAVGQPQRRRPVSAVVLVPRGPDSTCSPQRFLGHR